MFPLPGGRAVTEPCSTDRWSTWLTHGRFVGHSDDARRAAHRLLDRFRDGVLHYAGLHPGDRVLDVGAGTGLLSARAVELVGPTGVVAALDISLHALQQIAPGPRIVRLVGDAGTLPVRDASMDAVVVRSVLIYVSDVAAVLLEMARVLRPGGRISVFEPINKNRYHNVDLTDFDDRWGAVREPSNSLSKLDSDALVGMVSEAGFQAPMVVHDAVVERLETAAEVDGYLHRPPNPNAGAPIDRVAERLGAIAAQHFRELWHGKLKSGPVEFTTPVLYLSTAKST